ncbi:transcriptional regulator, TetR family [Microbacterium sp. cf046]|uniref:TetR/AcrR family transcriptional regulator n=1 Tax=Microbacterium sp. cf046 TaxID=1761803 RepID=UPI0008E95097|nr:TetR family transcriptional regulator [Microbacterium sp. cf046]SFS14717.1 transcriptional regulator, TetR family [Microbacterium sp. cf046]
MPEYAVPTPKRRRGRPRGGESDAQQRIIAAAVDEFGELGYDGATMRAIAARAGVDSALVHHYFGTKADLFAQTVGAPMRPDLDIPALLEGPQDALGERIVRYVLDAWERPETRKRGVTLLRTGVGNRLTTPLLAGFLQRELIGRIAARIDAPDAAFRASLVASQIAGMLLARYVLQLPAIAGASVDDIVARVGPTVQHYMTDPAVPAQTSAAGAAERKSTE